MTQVTTARIAGEPLHFRMQGDSAVAFAAAPVDSGAGLDLDMLCADGTRATVRVPTATAEYPLERLRVAPRFGTAPDSALAARQRREAQRAGAVSRASHDTPRLWSDAFIVPRESRITSGFGGGRTFNGTVTSRHMGTDYAGAVGAPVRASNRGVVRLVDAFYLGGNVVYIDHGAGVVTAYLHLSRQLVAEGDTVQRGDVIGHVGATGRVTGPHLHFIARYGNITIDAASLIGVR
jgi:murein DD-endopeptidase MepM/ murein hydrolase activator NlpD